VPWPSSAAILLGYPSPRVSSFYVVTPTVYRDSRKTHRCTPADS
jgi:hypothetical protein